MAEIEVISVLTYACYAFLYAAVLCLWVPYKSRIPLWSVLLAASFVCGLLSGQLDWYAIVPGIALAYSLYLSEKQGAALGIRVLCAVLVILLSYGLGAHVFSYFHNVKVLSNVYVSADGLPFTMYLNIDKAVAGLLLLGFTQRLLTTKAGWLSMCKEMLPLAVKIVAVLAVLVLMTGKVHVDLKLPEYTLLWLVNNLFFVCTAEEAFFRGFIQKQLAQLFIKVKWGDYLAIVIASLLFGFAHYAGGLAYNIWAIIAGLGYGWVYYKTKLIEASILTHFLLNAVHFFIFTYPALR